MAATSEIDYLGALTTSSYTIGYIVRGAADESEAIVSIQDTAPQTVNTVSSVGGVVVLYLSDITVAIDANCDVYKGTVTYNTNPPNDGFLESTDNTILSLQISSQQVMKYVFPQGDVVSTSAGFENPGNIPEGFPVNEPVVNFVVRKKYSSLSSGWGTTLADKIGMVNSSTLFGAPARCMMYMGASTGEFPDTGGTIETQIVHTYAYRKSDDSYNLVPVDGATPIVIPSKAGWDIINFQSGRVHLAANGTVRPSIVGYQIIKLPSGNIAP
jgi:hypothetical protein